MRYLVEHVQTITHKLVVTADSESSAEIKTSVGGIENVLQKESIHCIGQETETDTNVVRPLDDLCFGDLVIGDEFEVSGDDRLYIKTTGPNGPRSVIIRGKEKGSTAVFNYEDPVLLLLEE